MSVASWFRQTAYVASVTSTDNYGKAVYGTPRSFLCRVEGQRRMQRTSSGEESVSNWVMHTTEPILLTDRIWLPGRNIAQVEGSLVPMSVRASLDKAGARTLYRVEL